MPITVHKSLNTAIKSMREGQKELVQRRKETTKKGGKEQKTVRNVVRGELHANTQKKSK